jgi:hypothetical protein
MTAGAAAARRRAAYGRSKLPNRRNAALRAGVRWSSRTYGDAAKHAAMKAKLDRYHCVEARLCTRMKLWLVCIHSATAAKFIVLLLSSSF